MRHLPAVAIAAIFVSGCFDLSVPHVVPDAGPDVEFLSPVDGGIVSLSSFVQLQVVSLAGIQEVVLYCASDAGVSGLQTWFGGTEFQATVDLSPCAQGQSTFTLGNEQVVSTQLEAAAADTNDNVGSRTIEVFLDVTTPVLTILAPERVGPESPLVFTIQSDRPLAGPPAVSVGGQPALVTDAPGDTTNQSYVATLARTPLLGTVGYDGGTDGGDVPIEVLEAVEVPLPISIDAHDQQNGNLTHVSYQVLLSRLLWQRPVPGEISPPPGGEGAIGSCIGTPVPVAADAGIQLPLSTLQLFDGGGEDRCINGFMTAADGTFVQAPAQFQSPSVTLVGFDSDGRSLYYDGKSAYFVEPETGAVDQTVNNASALAFAAGGPPLLPVGDLLCQLENAACVGSVVCLSAASSSPLTQTFGPNYSYSAVYQASSGGTALWGSGTCFCGNCPSSGDFLMGPAPTVAPFADPFATVFGVFPVSNGFAFYWMPATGGLPQLSLLDTGGGITSPWTIPMGATPFAAFFSGLVVTSRFDGAYTYFEGWKPGNGSGTPDFHSRIPGPAQPAQIPGGVSVSDTALTVIVATIPPASGLAVLDMTSQLQPLWLYRYNPNAAGVSLVGAPTGGVVYLVDYGNQEVTAMPQ